jgi:hypothetical protein
LRYQGGAFSTYLRQHLVAFVSKARIDAAGRTRAASQSARRIFRHLSAGLDTGAEADQDLNASLRFDRINLLAAADGTLEAQLIGRLCVRPDFLILPGAGAGKQGRLSARDGVLE